MGTKAALEKTPTKIPGMEYLLDITYMATYTM